MITHALNDDELNELSNLVRPLVEQNDFDRIRAKVHQFARRGGASRRQAIMCDDDADWFVILSLVVSDSPLLDKWLESKVANNHDLNEVTKTAIIYDLARPFQTLNSYFEEHPEEQNIKELLYTSSLYGRTEMLRELLDLRQDEAPLPSNCLAAASTLRHEDCMRMLIPLSSIDNVRRHIQENAEIPCGIENLDSVLLKMKHETSTLSKNRTGL